MMVPARRSIESCKCWCDSLSAQKQVFRNAESVSGAGSQCWSVQGLETSVGVFKLLSGKAFSIILLCQIVITLCDSHVEIKRLSCSVQTKLVCDESIQIINIYN